MADFIFPKEVVRDKAELILRSSGLQLITPKFFNFDQNNISIEQAENEAALNDYKAGYFGQPIFDVIEFPAHSYTRPENGEVIKNSGVFLETALIDLNLPKNIVKTQIQGRNGTVKEYIGMDDWQITINGAVISKHANVPPTKEIEDIWKLTQAPIALNIYSNFLNHFGIYSVVIENFASNQIEGTRNAIGFTLTCTSDIPFEIAYNENKTVVTRSRAFF